MELKIVCDDKLYLPVYANDTDACMDLKIKIENPHGSFYLQPNGTKVFKTGIKAQIPENHVMLIFPRSSLGVNKKCRLMNGTGVIDAGYRDEIKLPIHNFGEQSIEFVDGERIAQFMIIPRPKIEIEIVPDNEEFKQGNRGGGIGSTGVK